MHKGYPVGRVPFAILLAVALVLLSGCNEQLLIPPELKGLRAEFEATAAAYREAGLEEMRQAPSSRELVVVGTVAPDAPLASTPSRVPPSATTTPTPSTTPMPTATMTPTLTFTPSATTGVVARVTVMTMAATNSKPSPPTAQMRRTVVVRETTPTPQVTRSTTPAGTPATARTVAATAPAGTATGRKQVVDVITEQMLGGQVRKEVTQATIKNLVIDLTLDGFTATGQVSIILGLQRPLAITGVFAVEHESLVGRVTSIRLAGSDVTTQYRDQLEDRINWSLYQLLPQRYVKSFDLSQEAITVHSEMKQ